MAILDLRLPPSFTDDRLRVALQARREVPGLKDRVFNDDQFIAAAGSRPGNERCSG